MQINNDEIHALFIGALQYSFGRRTYFPGWIQDIIKEHWKEIPENTKERIIFFTTDAIDINDKFKPESHSNQSLTPANSLKVMVNRCR